MNNKGPINHSVFLMPVHDPNKPLAQCYDEDLEFVVLAEELGFSDFWVGEHHSSLHENIVMPEIFIGKALGMTDRIRLGPAPVCLQYHDPIHVAGRLAFLDHLSRGRLNVAFGPGAVPSDLELFAIDPKKSTAMVTEAIDMILHLWTTDIPYEYEGEFWNMNLANRNEKIGMGYLHKPFQSPYPPIYTPAVSRNSETTKMAGAKGFKPIAHHMLAGNVIANIWETYKNASTDAGREARPSDYGVARNIFVADTTDEARQRARNGSIGKCIQYIMDVTDTTPIGRTLWKRDLDTPDNEVDIDYFMNEHIIAGDPDEVVRQLLQLVEETGPFGTLLFTAHDWDDRESWIRCINLFAKDVMPELNRQVT